MTLSPTQRELRLWCELWLWQLVQRKVHVCELTAYCTCCTIDPRSPRSGSSSPRSPRDKCADPTDSKDDFKFVNPVAEDDDDDDELADPTDSKKDSNPLDEE